MSEWISVDTRMPESFQSVIACRKGAGITNMFYDENIRAWEQDGYGHLNSEKYYDVTHWMPLPEPPQ